MASPALRVVLLTGTGPEHAHVARTLAASEVKLVGVVVVERPPTSASARMWRGIRRFGWTGMVTRALTRLALRAAGEATRRTTEVHAILGEPDLPPDIPLRRTVGVNSEATLEAVTSLVPDVLCVYGTAIVGAKVLATASMVPLNMHTGISPDYRGADCAFWPIHNAELDLLGATVHECTASVDAGPIYGVARARLQRGDGVGAVFARCVQAGAVLMVRALVDLAQDRAVPTPQDTSRGTEYRAAMRTCRAEARVIRRVRHGLIDRYVSHRAGNPFGLTDERPGT